MAIEAEQIQIVVSANNTDQVVAQVEGITKASQKASEQAGFLESQLNGFSASGFLDTLSTVAGILGGFAGVWELVGGPISDQIGKIKKSISNLTSPLTILINIFRSLGSTAKGTWLTIYTGVKNLPATIYAFATALTTIPGKIRNLANTFAGVLLPKLKIVKNLLGGLPSTVLSLASSFSGGLITALRGAIVWLGKLPVMLLKQIPAMLTSISMTGLLSGAMSALSTVASLATSAIAALTASFMTFAVPLALVAAAVGALYVAWKKNFLGIRNITKNTINLIKALLRGDMKTVKKIIGNALAQLRIIWKNKIRPLIKDARKIFKQIQHQIAKVLHFIYNNLIKDTINQIRSVWKTHGRKLITEAQRTWNVIWGVISPIVNTILSLLTSATNKGTSLWDRYGDELMAITKAVFDVISGTIGTALDGIMTAIRTILALIRGDWKKAWNIMAGFVDRTIKGIGNFIAGSGKKAILAAVHLIVDAIKGLGDMFWNAGKGLIDALVNGIKSAGSNIWDVISGIASDAMDLFPGSDAKTGPLSELTESGKALPVTVAKGIKANTQPLARASEQAALAAKPTLEVAGAPFPDIGGKESSSSSVILNVDVDARGTSDPQAVGTAVATELRSVLPR